MVDMSLKSSVHTFSKFYYKCVVLLYNDKIDKSLNYLLFFRVCLIMFRHAFFFLKHVELHKVKKKPWLKKFDELHKLLHKI